MDCIYWLIGVLMIPECHHRRAKNVVAADTRTISRIQARCTTKRVDSHALFQFMLNTRLSTS